jgi:hypothetical protein
VWIDFVANGLPVQGLVLSDPDRIATPLFPTFFISGSCDARGRRLVQLVYRTPALQLALGTWYLPGPALIPPALVAWLLIRLRVASAGPGPSRHYLSKLRVFMG